MQFFLTRLRERLEPAEEIFFKWLTRVFIAGILVGSAGIDDAPPLEIAALILLLYVFFRVAMECVNLYSVAPFRGKLPNALFAIVAFLILVFSLLTVVTFVDRISNFVVD